jgi:hypothetical protein
MAEFTTENPKSFNPIIAIVAAVILILASGGVYYYARHQRMEQPPGTTAGPIVIPGMVRPGDTNFEYYKNKIRIANVKAGLGITFSKARVALISYTVANEGDRKLEGLELKFSIFDLYQKPSKDRITTPVRPDRPMEPLETRAFSVGIESVEQLWDPKRLEVVITGLKYK